MSAHLAFWKTNEGRQSLPKLLQNVNLLNMMLVRDQERDRVSHSHVFESISSEMRHRSVLGEQQRTRSCVDLVRDDLQVTQSLPSLGHVLQDKLHHGR